MTPQPDESYKCHFFPPHPAPCPLPPARGAGTKSQGEDLPTSLGKNWQPCPQDGSMEGSGQRSQEQLMQADYEV